MLIELNKPKKDTTAIKLKIKKIGNFWALIHSKRIEYFSSVVISLSGYSTSVLTFSNRIHPEIADFSRL